jgi:hypothetical protein
MYIASYVFHQPATQQHIDLNITGNTSVLLGFGSSGSSLKMVYTKAKHAGAYNVFILYLIF